jgi:hypothetical protein
MRAGHGYVARPTRSSEDPKIYGPGAISALNIG